MKTQKILSLGALAASLFLCTGGASAQILDGEYWKGTLSGATRVVLAPDAPEPGPEGVEVDPSTLTLEKSKLAKTVVYLLTEWNAEDGYYHLTAFTDQNGEWVAQEDAGSLEPFGDSDSYPDSRQGALEMHVLTDATEGSEKEVSVYGLVSIKAKEDTKAENPAVNEEQMLAVTEATKGTYVLSYDSEATDPLAFDANLDTVGMALEGLSTIGAGNVAVTGASADMPPYTVEFVGDLAGMDLPAIMVDSNDTDGTVEVTITQEGAPAGGPVLKSGSVKLDKVGAEMEAFDYCGLGNEMIGSPKFSAKRVPQEKLPFDVGGGDPKSM